MLYTDFISMEDWQLAAFLENKNQASLDYFYNKYSWVLYGLLHRITNDRHLAEECLLATFVKAWNEIATFKRSDTSLFTWLLPLARQAALEGLEKEKEKITMFHTFETGYNRHFSALELVYYKGLSLKQAAELSGLTLIEIKIHLRMDLKIRKDKTKKA